jgi:Uncharacterized protein conserved in bacteria
LFFVFRGIDHDGLNRIRDTLLESHREYVRQEASVKMIYGGPLYDAQDQTIGSCLILEADSKQDVEAWLSAEPFYNAGLFAMASIDRWGWSYGR